MEEISNKTIMHQIRRNVLDDLVTQYYSDPRKEQEFFEFISNEPVEISRDHVMRVISNKKKSFAVFKTCQPTFMYDNPKPLRLSWRPHYLKIYLRQMLRYIIVKILYRYLSRLIDFKEYQKVVAITHADIALPTTPPPSAKRV